MKKEDRMAYARMRIDSAHSTFEAAKILAESKHWNSAVNRLYYALFYAVNAYWFCTVFPQGLRPNFFDRK